MRIFITCFLVLSLIFPFYAFTQETPEAPTEAPVPDRQSRGSIPEALLRPARGESPRYPIDTVIGELGRGQAPQEAYFFADSLCEGLLSIDMGHSAIASISSSLRETFLTSLNAIEPLYYRIGGGREEVDGAVSFLIRFAGRDQAISGELYVRRVSGNWTFDELLLDEAKSREVERQEAANRNDFNPYERFY
ncbi:MAG: hypothetical protein FWB73_08990 [Treponema sp.]|nr:hypothetical protein [Treponema sp.]